MLGLLASLVVDKTFVRIGRYEAWVCVAIEFIRRYIFEVYLSVCLSRFRNIKFVVLFIYLRTRIRMYVRKTFGVH